MADKPFNNPFGKLGAMREELVPTRPQVSASDFPETPPASGPERAVIRPEVRGGKDFTLVEELGLSPEELESLRLALQRGLAARASTEGARLVIEGDHRFSLPDLLLRRGVKRIQQKGVG